MNRYGETLVVMPALVAGISLRNVPPMNQDGRDIRAFHARLRRTMPGDDERKKRACPIIPGEMFVKDGTLELNAGRKTLTLTVANTGDRPI